MKKDELNPIQNKWLQWVKELQAVAQAGLYYGGTQFDKERYQVIRDISAKMMADLAELPVETITELFCGETGYQTPKIVTRAAVFKDDKILLVQENYKKWTLPGGWSEPGITVRENAIKEVEEESGIIADADYMIAIIDKDKHSPNIHPFTENVVYIHCTPKGGHFEENSETIGMGFFSLDEISQMDIDETKVAFPQIEMCFEAHKACPGKPVECEGHWNLFFD